MKRWETNLKTRIHIFVSGRVQGVFFRSETMREARKRGLTGLVRNLPDGRVEAIFEGEKYLISELVEFCKVGPLGAKVTNVQVISEPYTGKFKDFRMGSA